ncbi:Peroxidase [Eumeta japonica]|uniref:Peroxidase n=1 Tax=Eumeta variegata TaxID=151549 RepID=A0A4C1WVM4_EUMVA|nr:Peroxidase [Eumeta japonica]
MVGLEKGMELFWMGFARLQAGVIPLIHFLSIIVEKLLGLGLLVNGVLLAIMDSKTVSRQARLAIHNGVLILARMHNSESWVWQKKNEGGINAVKMRSPCSMCGVSQKDRCKNSDVRRRRGLKEDIVIRVETDKGIRVSASGEPLPSARRVRTALLHTGRVVDNNFNIAALQFAGFSAADVSFVDGVLDYIFSRTYCCEPEGQADPRCVPIAVPDDDPYLRVTDIRCLNFSRAQTFQDSGCIPTTLPPEQINFQTPTLDLSIVYGVNDEALALVRGSEKGLLRMEIRNNRYVPPGDATSDCSQNMPNETVCYRFGYSSLGNFDLRLATITIFFAREHNRIAKALAAVNPCWADDRLFGVARQINIATFCNILVYELLPLLLGYENMLNYGLISDKIEYTTAYDSHAEPNLYAEFVIGMRYFHTFAEGRIKTYDAHYRESAEYSISDTLFRTGLIEQNHTFEEINRGTFYQKSGSLDDIVDPDAKKFYSKFHRANDLLAIDIQRGRDMGVRGYNAYRRLCGMKYAQKFDDFLDTMDVEKVDVLKKLYKEVDDVDLQAGITSERHIQGGYVGPTLFCIMVKQLQLLKYGDRFWFERGDQFHSFTLPQLREVRGTTMARFACDNAEGLDRIQPKAFLNVGFG